MRDKHLEGPIALAIDKLEPLAYASFDSLEAERCSVLLR